MANNTITDAKKKWLNKAAARTAGCPLFEGRTKGELDDLEGSVVTLEDAYRMTGEEEGSFYYVFTIDEESELFYMSCKSISQILEDAEAIAAESGITLREVIEGTTIKIGAKRKTKGGKSYRPIEI